MKQLIRYTLVTLLVASVSFASSWREAKDEKIQAEKEYRKAALAGQNSFDAASSAWKPLNLGGSYTLKYVDYRPSGVVWAMGFSATGDFAFYSNNNGQSWTMKQLPATTNAGYSNLASANDTVAVAADYDGNLYRTVDKGQNWTKVYTYSTPDTGWFDGVNFFDGTTAIAFGDADFAGLHVVKTTDAGATWTRLTNLPDSAKTAYRFFGLSTYGAAQEIFDNTVWIAYYSSSAPRRMIAPVIKSTDRGATWTFSEANLTGTVNNYFFRSLKFKDANNGWGAGRQITSSSTTNFPLHKTTDGGATWSDSLVIEPGIPGTVNKAYIPQPIRGTNKVMLVGLAGSASATWWSEDNGATFTKLLTPFTGAWRAIGYKDSANIIAGGPGAYKFEPTVAVTFRVNTSTVPDTIKSTSTVQMRGDDGNLLQWGGGSAVRFANTTSGAGASDFWTVTARFKPGQTFPYKIFTNVNANVGAGHPQEHNGWEGNLSDPGQDGNRRLVVGQNDTTIMLQFVNGSPGQQLQYWRPYTESDSIEVRFRVNMANVEDFNPLTMKMGVRGSQAPLQWGQTFFLTQEQNDGNNPTRYPGNNFWSGTIKLPFAAPYAANDTVTVYYKFVQHLNSHTATTDPVKWEDGIVRTNAVDIEPGGGSNPARIFAIKKGMQDTTLYWKWWANQGVKPPLGNDTAFVTFRVNMLKAVNTNSYTIGDTVQVRHGFANSATTVKTKNLTRLGSTFIYTAVDTVYGTKIAPTANLVYQYYLVKGGVDLREVYYNFEFTGSDVSLAERRLLPMTAKTLTAADTSTDPSKATRQPFWRNTRKLARVVDVKFTVDLRPAYQQVKFGLNGKDTLLDIQGPWTINKSVVDSIYVWGVAINGPATGGWATWGASLYADTTRKMFDNGTHGDLVAGDRVYTRHYVFGPDSGGGRNLVGQEFKFGIRGGDNEGGKGGYGNNHIENINDGTSTATIASYFGSINPLYYDQFNFETGQPLLNVRQDEMGLPIAFALEQNYPNPFNPSTSIKYSIPVGGMVTLKIFNILGQEVATLVNESLEAGSYTASFNASALSSGVYLYKIESGSFTSVKKMMLLK
jgi:photosystem II stability/assembly factor-like uncharacterized protein